MEYSSGLFVIGVSCILLSYIKIHQAYDASVLYMRKDGSITTKNFTIHYRGDGWMHMDELKEIICKDQSARIIGIRINSHGYKIGE